MKKLILIFFSVIIFIGLIGAILISATGIIKIPILSDIFYREPVGELDIKIDYEKAKDLEKKLGIEETIFEDKIITELKITDDKLSSLVTKTCLGLDRFFAYCPFESFQIKFPGYPEQKFIASVHITEPRELRLTIFGQVFKKDETNVDLKIEKVYLGNLRIFFIEREVEREAERVINKNLNKMLNFRIDKLKIYQGKMIFEGVLHSAEIKNLLDKGLYLPDLGILGF